MKNKGFTLMELLAVILIIAIIALIIVPIGFDVVSDGKKKSYFQSANQIKKAINEYYFDYGVNFSGYDCIFPDNCSEIEIKGNIPSFGRVVIDKNGNINGYLVFENSYEFGIFNDEIFDNINYSYEFDYNDREKQFDVIHPGYYKLEVWGAQGGSTNGYTGGYGGYSTGIIKLNEGEKLNVVVGGKGISSYGDVALGGYNGGGSCRAYVKDSLVGYCGSGGGATHIAFNVGQLYELEDNKSSIIIVAGGGGGAAYTNDVNYGNGGSGGGYIGGTATSDALHFTQNGYGQGGTQELGGCKNYGDRCGTFGLGYSDSIFYENPAKINTAGGGGGYYGGGGTQVNSAGGGSGYIGHDALTDKFMSCYDCDVSNSYDTFTKSVEDVSSEPISESAKIGNGYARITYLGLKN